MSTIRVITENGNDITFHNADNIAGKFMAGHGVFMPYEIDFFGHQDNLEDITVFSDNEFKAKYVFNKIVVRVEATKVGSLPFYTIETGIKFDPLHETFAELHEYESRVNLPTRRCYETASQVAGFLAEASEQCN